MQTHRSSLEPSAAADPHTCSHHHRLEILCALPFFAGLDDTALHEVNASFSSLPMDAGEPIYMAGDPATRLYVVAVGAVKIVRHTLRGKDVLLGILGPGELFGSLAILGDSEYADTAEAKTDGCILAIDAHDFDALLRRYPAAAVATLGTVAARLQEAHEAIHQLAALSVEQRLAAELLRLAARHGERHGNSVRITLPLARQELGDKVGATVETVSRVLSRFEREGVIESGRQWIAVSDVDALVELATERD